MKPSLTTLHIIWASLIAQLEKAMAPHSSALAWKIPWMEEPGGLQSVGSDMTEQSTAAGLPADL